MKRTTAALCVLAAILLLSAVASASYEITSSVIGSGGGAGSAGSYSVIGTIGQPLIGVASGGSYINEIGFWYQPGWILTGVAGDLIPTKYELGQNYPNPFNPVTTFRFGVPREARVTVKLYDVAGREVRTLADDTFGPGYHTVPLYADGMPSGVYFCRMTADSFSATRKLMLLK
jgi:hypothetical protein